MSLTVTPPILSLRIFAVAAFLFALNGCVNMDDAAGLSTLSNDARTALPKVSNDIAGTCERQNTLFDNTPEKERPKDSKALDCKPYQALASQVAKDQNILLDYFDALGKLSSNKPLGYDAAIDTDVTDTSAISSVSTHAVTAANDAQSILKALADAATKGYREKQLDQLIKDNDPAVQSLTQALKKIIVGDYGIMLSNEESSLDGFYQGPMDAAQSQSNERLALILVQRQYANDKSALQSRKDNVASYGKTMDGLAALDAKLAKEATQKASLVEMGKQAAPIVESIKNAVSDLHSR
jgi:hypothetical protein